jgi:hypothetical protein
MQRVSKARQNAMVAILRGSKSKYSDIGEINAFSADISKDSGRSNQYGRHKSTGSDDNTPSRHEMRRSSKDDENAHGDEIERLTELLELREIELREAQYELNCMRRKESERQESYERDLNMKERELSENSEKSQRAVESERVKYEEKSRAAVSECERLLRFVLAIEKHTLHGRHAVGSQTVMGLLMKTRQGTTPAC